MNIFKEKVAKRIKRKARTRIKIHGTPDRPRLSVFRSLVNIYVQAVDDVGGITIASASTIDKELKDKVTRRGNIDAAKEVGKLIGQRLVNKGVMTVVFDKGGYKYHGRVKALAEGARSAGLKF
jgi:large subunit ribosomal protein L18